MNPIPIIRTRRKSIALVIDSTGNASIRAPLRYPASLIERFIAMNQSWLQKKMAGFAEKKAILAPKQFVDQEPFIYLGKTYSLKITDLPLKHIRIDHTFLELPKKHAQTAEIHLTQWYKKRAKEIISDRVAYYANIMQFTYKSIRITSAKTRWGSCSGKNSLNFTWRLICAPLDVIDYVVIHELVHIHIKNHSKGFWKTVEQVMPDYTEKRKWLKINGFLCRL